LIVVLIVVVFIIILAGILRIWRWPLVTAALLLTTNAAFQQVAEDFAKPAASRPNVLAEWAPAMQIDRPLRRSDI
jgi:hypothetical protein